MSKIIAIHSFRRGTGKTSLTANIATLLAASGQRVGIVDTALQSPSTHILFGLDDSDIPHPVNDYLWGKCEIKETVHDITPRLEANISGKLFLVPASTAVKEIAHALRQKYEAGVLNEGLLELITDLDLDALLLDTYAGLHDDTLRPISVADTLVLIMRPDQQDYQGTAVTLNVARKLQVPHVLLVANMVSTEYELSEVRAEIERSYECEVATVLPYSDEMMTLASADIFVIRHPNHPITDALKQLTHNLLA